jgi:hypothetical protein
MGPFDGREKRFGGKKFLKILVIVILAITVLSFVVMGLWNAVLVPVLHVGMVNFWQAMGLLVLSKILFGGFKGRGGGGWKGHHEWRQNMREKWEKMTPEERDQFKRNFQNKCRGGWRRQWPMEETTQQTNAGAE